MPSRSRSRSGSPSTTWHRRSPSTRRCRVRWPRLPGGCTGADGVHARGSGRTVLTIARVTTLPLTPDELLTTTRTVRRRLDLTRDVPLSLVRECLEIALQAPSGSNRQGWHWVVVTDADRRAAIGEVYRRAVEDYLASPGFAGRLFADDAERAAVQQRVG